MSWYTLNSIKIGNTKIPPDGGIFSEVIRIGFMRAVRLQRSFLLEILPFQN